MILANDNDFQYWRSQRAFKGKYKLVLLISLFFFFLIFLGTYQFFFWGKTIYDFGDFNKSNSFGELL
jgi:hypothetical protein